MRAVDEKTVVMDVAVEKIRVAPNPRGKSNAGAMKELVESVRQHGLLQPLVCCRDGENGEDLWLVAGTRRLFAAKEAGLRTVPVTVRQGLTQDEIVDIQIEENLQREDLDPIDEGKYLAEYRGKCTIEELAKRIGKSPGHITQRIALAKRLIPPFQKMVRDGALPLVRAQVLSALSPADQERMNPSRKGVQSWQKREAEQTLTRGNLQEFRHGISEILHRVSSRPWKKVKSLEAKNTGVLPSCEDCMDRSDRQGLLIPEAGDGKDASCLNTSCWETHLTAWLTRSIERFKAEGRRILTTEEAGKVVRQGYGGEGHADFGTADGKDLPWEVERSGKYKSKCRTCGNLGFYIGSDRTGEDRDVRMACLDRACFKERRKRSGEKSYQAKEREAFSDVDLKGSAQTFATAAWAMAKARGVKMPGADLNAMAAAVLVLAELVHVGSKERYALKWILEEGGCKGAGGLNSFGKLLAVPNLEDTGRALAYFLAVGGNLFEGKTGEIAGDLSEIMPKARKLFSPSSPLFLETLLRSSIQSVGRHYKVKGIGGKRDDAIKAIVAAKLTSEVPMLKALEQCFAGKKGAKK